MIYNTNRVESGWPWTLTVYGFYCKASGSNLGGGGVLLGILGGGVPPGSSNPDPISDQKM